MLQRYVKEVFCTTKQSVIVSLYVIEIKYKNPTNKSRKNLKLDKKRHSSFPNRIGKYSLLYGCNC